MRFLAITFFVLECCLFSGLYGEALTLRDIYGKPITFFKKDSVNASVFIFTTTDCPIANSLSPTIKRIYKEFEDDAVRFTLVYVDKDLSEDKVKRHSKDYGLNEIENIIIDRQHKIINLSKAELTPQAAIFGSDHQLKYIGAINNLFSDYGDKKARATKHYLRDNLKNVLAGKDLPYSETKTYGCYIPKD